MKKFGQILLTIILTLMIAAAGLGWLAYRESGRELLSALTSRQGQAWTTAQAPVPTPNTRPGRWYLSAKQQQWTLQRPGGVQLKAGWFPGQQKRTAVLLPGFGQRRSAMYQAAYFFNQAGYNVLAIDSRGQGASQGKVSFGYREKEDLQAWLKQVAKAAGPQNQTVVFGVSMGAATALQAAALPLPQVKAIIADSAYTSFEAELAYQARKTLKLPVWAESFILHSVDQAAQDQAGFSLWQTDCRPALRKNKLPILFIHGQADRFVPAAMSQQNFKADQGPKQLWLVPGAEHIQALSHNEGLYQERILSFCQRWVK